METREHDLLVIGAGPGGYVAAIRAAQLGLKVGCIEKESALGGTCLRVGCIPSKALLESSELYTEARFHFAKHGLKISDLQLDLGQMMQRKSDVVKMLTKGVEGLFKKNKITRYSGSARFISANTVEVTGKDSVQITAKSIIIATGSAPIIPAGIELHPEGIGTSTEALAYEKIPKNLVVIGAGYIGLELGSVWQRLGSKVTVLEFQNRILPGMDLETATEAQKIFEKQGIEFKLQDKVLSARFENGKATVKCETSGTLEADKVLVAVGRKANTEGLNLEAAGVQLDNRGRIAVDPHFQTSAKNVFAIGDVIAGPMLAHKAEEEGVACVEQLVNGHGHIDYNVIPGIVYTNPEIATVGKSEEELQQAGVQYRTGIFPFRGNGRAHALAKTEGKVKILADTTTDRILGVHIIGPRAGDLISEAVVAMTFHASSEDLARCIHAHPTLSEAMKEAALGVEGRSIHI
jgi:dihydrolipoamide dehydrogenase